MEAMIGERGEEEAAVAAGEGLRLISQKGPETGIKFIIISFCTSMSIFNLQIHRTFSKATKAIERPFIVGI